MDKLKKEIIFCNLILQNGKNKLHLKNVVYKHTDGYFKNSRDRKSVV